MKRTIIAFTLVSAIFILRPTLASAQDLILTTEDKIIEAIIQRITDNTITYKMYDNPDGPTYETSTTKIVKICFENGTEQKFSNPVNDRRQKAAAVPESAKRPDRLLYRKGRVYLGGHELRDYEMSQLLPRDLYRSIEAGKGMYKHGRNLIIAGTVIEASAIALFITGIVLYEPLPLTIGYATFAVGLPCLGAGIPIFCVGKHRIRNAASEFNVLNGYREFALNIGNTGNGFGIYVNF